MPRVVAGLFHEIGNMQASLTFNDATRLGVIWIGLLLMPLNHVEPLNNRTLFGFEDLEDLSGFALVASADDYDNVVSFNVHFHLKNLRS